MTQNEATEQNKKDSLPQLPWAPIFWKPQMSFRMPKIALPHEAPHQWISGLLVVVSLFLLAGGIYNLAESPLPLGFTDSGYQPIFTSLNDQFLVESFSAMVFIGLGAAGFFLLRYPTQRGYGTDIRSVSFIQGIAILLVLLGVSAAVIMLEIKTGGSF